MRTLLTAVLVTFLCGCASAVSEKPDAPIRGQYWVSPDRTEILVAFPEKGEAYYFNNNASRQCYTYKVQGKWRPSVPLSILWTPPPVIKKKGECVRI
jgi:hypothetical protein